MINKTKIIYPYKLTAKEEYVKREVRKLVSEADKSAKDIDKTISGCNLFHLSYLLGDVAEARGAAAVLIKIHPEDTEIKQIWKDAVDAHIQAYKGRDKFHQECDCKRKDMKLYKIT